MREAPQQPGEEAAQPDAAEIGDGRLAADRGEVAVVDIAERLGGRLPASRALISLAA